MRGAGRVRLMGVLVRRTLFSIVSVVSSVVVSSIRSSMGGAVLHSGPSGTSISFLELKI